MPPRTEFRPIENRPGDGRPGLYLHLPFCTSICPYCDFAVSRGGEEARARFVDGLCLEIDRWRAPDTVFDTVYFGGGTPSALSDEQLERILGALAAQLLLAEDASLSLEVNPEDVDRERARRWLQLGFERISLGVQSFDDERLRRLGRAHRGRQARAAVETALATGFETVSFDLIYALPGQSVDSWRRELEAAAELGAHHLSCYELTIHEGTPFARLARSPGWSPPDPDRLGEHFLVTHEVLADRGYEGYEVSNFARAPHHVGRHNSKYWRQVPYLGLGPSAHSFDGARRWWNVRGVGEYVRLAEAGESLSDDGEILSRTDLRLEALMLGLRTRDGIDLDRFRRRFDEELMVSRRALIDSAIEAELLVLDGRALRPTTAGMAIADDLTARLA